MQNNNEGYVDIDITNRNSGISDRIIPYVLVVGGANVEYIYKKEEDTKLFIKQNYSGKSKTFGGSGLNYALKLMGTKINVFPILPLGNDEQGKEIKERLCQAQKNIRQAKFDLTELDILSNDVQTRESLIISEKKGRTIWSNSNSNVSNIMFNKIIDRNFTTLEDKGFPKIVMIGHIHSDANLDINDISKLSTYKLIMKYQNNSFLYVNFGKSQLSYGFDFWENTLKNIDILQFNLEELKHFFSNNTECKNSLVSILEKLKELKLTVVITLDKLGAICVIKNVDKIIYAQELVIKDFKDKTGAGDSFACGIVYELMKIGTGSLTSHLLKQAIETGRTWASFTCTHLGGAEKCPDEVELNIFYRDIVDNIESWGMREIKYDDVNLIDKAYSRCQHNSN